MTELLTRPPAVATDAQLRRGSVWVRGAFAAAWAASLGLATLVVIVLVAWAADSRAGSSATDAIRSALQIWLVAHRVPLHVDGGTIAIAPLLLTLALGFLIARAAALVARTSDVTQPLGVAVVATAVGLPYAVVTTFVAAGAKTAAVTPSPAAALGAGLVIGWGFAAWGAARGAGLVGACWRLLPESARIAARAGAVATAVLATAGALLLAAAFAVNIADAGRALHVLGGGAVGGSAVVALDVALLPNAIVCALGYLAGPGFAVGAGTSVTMSGAHVDSLPALPLLAAVPNGPAPALLTAIAVAAVVGGGVLAAWLIARAGCALVRSVVLATAAGGAAGLLTAALAALAGGPAGPGRMSAVGASPWQTGLAVAAEIGVVAAGAVAVLTWRRGR